MTRHSTEEEEAILHAVGRVLGKAQQDRVIGLLLERDLWHRAAHDFGIDIDITLTELTDALRFVISTVWCEEILQKATETYNKIYNPKRYDEAYSIFKTLHGFA